MDILDKKVMEIEFEKYYPEFTLKIGLTVNRGEFFSLVGPSGCGKTTLLRLIAGLERPEKGRIILEGKDVTALSPVKRKIGFVFQDYALFPHLSVGENIAYGLKVINMSRQIIYNRVKELLELFSLQGLEKRDIHQLSGGERQRVALARALAPQPLILLLDEPFSALDYGLRQKLRGELKELQRRLGFTAIFVTHHQEEALSLSERLAVMRNGRIMQVGTAQEVYNNPENRFVAEFLGDANLIPCRLTCETEPARPREIRLTNGDVLSLEQYKDKALRDYIEGDYYLMIRPEDLVINSSECADFEGIISKKEYYGYNNRLEIRVNDYTLRAMVGKTIPGIAEGEKVKIGFDRSCVRLIPRMKKKFS